MDGCMQKFDELILNDTGFLIVNMIRCLNSWSCTDSRYSYSYNNHNKKVYNYMLSNPQ